MRLLNRRSEHPIGARLHRNVLVTAHSVTPDSGWVWEPQVPDGSEVLGLVFPHSAVTWSIRGRVTTAAVGDACVLHPYESATLTAVEPGVVSCVWVPWRVVTEIEAGLSSLEGVVPPTPFSMGLRGFLTSLISHSATPTAYTDYLVEQALAEMVFGVLVEATSLPTAGVREQRPIDRARSAMLIRRADPEFGVEELARELHMSPRQLQRVFAAEGSSPADELRRFRVDLAASMLTDERYRPLTMEQIALHAGFGNAAALRRAFATLGLPSPKRARTMSSR